MSETVEANKRAAIGVGPKHKYKRWNVVLTLSENEVPYCTFSGTLLGFSKCPRGQQGKNAALCIQFRVHIDITAHGVLLFNSSSSVSAIMAD